MIRPDAIGHQQAVRLVELFRRFPVQDLTSGMMMAALDARQRFQLSYRDAAIIEASPLRRDGLHAGPVRRPRRPPGPWWRPAHQPVPLRNRATCVVVASTGQLALRARHCTGTFFRLLGRGHCARSRRWRRVCGRPGWPRSAFALGGPGLPSFARLARFRCLVWLASAGLAQACQVACSSESCSLFATEPRRSVS